VDAGYRGLLARARGYREGWREALAGRQEEIRMLLVRVEHLYSTMDAELRFHVPDAAPSPNPPAAPAAVAPKAADTGGSKATVEMDLRGVACPMNFVKAKLKLESMDAGDTLAIVLDDGEPIRNVPASFKAEGQGVGEITSTGDGHWRVVVRKAK
jgi:TusA-related sulfurtransferase